MNTVTDFVVIANKLGMHLRPSQQIVQTVLQFTCDVYFRKDGHQVNAKSIMGLVTPAAAQGTQLEVVCEGDDAAAALEAVRELSESGFGEEM